MGLQPSTRLTVPPGRPANAPLPGAAGVPGGRELTDGGATAPPAAGPRLNPGPPGAAPQSSRGTGLTGS